MWGIRQHVLVLGALLGITPAAAARRFVELGPSDGIALDQPRVSVEFLEGDGTSLGPDIASDFLLDTGAERIVIAGSAFSELEDNGYQTDGVIIEQGVSGFTSFDLSVPYRLDFAGTSGEVVTLDGVRALSNPAADFGSFGGIIGMPGMVGRVAGLDYSGFGTGDFFEAFVAVNLGSTLPAGHGHRYTVPLELFEFPLAEPDPPSTANGVPFMTVIVDGPSRKRRGRFLLDTGAQLSIISEHLAFDLGLDTDGDGNFVNEQVTSVEISGVGGNISVPILEIGSVVLPTAEGLDLIWTDVAVIILEIDPRIDGVFGSDFLTSGWLEAFLFGEGEGFIQQVQLDFREADQLRGVLALDITAALDTPAPGLPPVDLDGDDVQDEWELLFDDDLDGPLADVDGDQLALLLENALNTDPRHFDANPLRVTPNPDGTVTVRFPRNVELPFSELTLQTATSLADPEAWSTVVADATETFRHDALTEWVSITLTPPRGGTCFYRLHVEALQGE